MGFKGVRQRVIFNTREGRIPLDLKINAFVELDVTRRGAHLSRNIDALMIPLLQEHVESIESYLEKVSDKLLELHDYALRAIVEANTVYYVDVKWMDIEGKEPVDVRVTVSKTRSGLKTWKVEVSVRGMSVCPSAMNTISEITSSPWGLAPSHSQKVVIKGSITTKGEFVRIEDIAKALISSPSAPTFTRLKRLEEAKLILNAFKNPKFVEDIARDAMCNLFKLAKEKGLENSFIEVEVESFESIHPHNVYASRSASFLEIENEIRSCFNQ